MPQQKLQPQPAVGVAAVAASCKTCRPPASYQRLLQQPWAGMTAPAAQFHQPAMAAAPGRHRGAARAVEPGPEHAASRRALPAAWARTSGGAVKRSRTAVAQDVATPTTNWAQYLQTPVVGADAGWPATPSGLKECAGKTQEWGADNGYYAATSTATAATVTGQCARGVNEDSRILWNNESMLRLFQV